MSKNPITHSSEWTLTLALALISTIGYGVYYYTFGALLPAMEAAGWSRTLCSGAFSLSLFVAGVLALPLGWWVDHRGARGLMTLGSLVGVGAVWLWSVSDTVWMLYLAFIGLGFALAATTYEVSFNVVAAWLTPHHRRAMWMITLFGALASTIFIPLATFLSGFLGWREALQLLTLLLLLVTVPLSFFLVKAPPQTQQKAEKKLAQPFVQTLKSRPFLLLAAAFALSGMAQMALIAHMVVMLNSRGLNPALVAVAVGSVGVMQLFGRILFAWLSRFSPVYLTAGSFAVQAFACLLLLVLPLQYGLWVFVALIGIAYGLITLTRPVVIAEQFNPAQFGRVIGSMGLIGAVMQVFGPLGAGFVSQQTGDFTLVLYLLAGLFGMAALLVWGVDKTGKI